MGVVTDNSADLTFSSNFGNVFSVLVANIVLPFLPMRAIQLLVQNLLYDIEQVFLPWEPPRFVEGTVDQLSSQVCVSSRSGGPDVSSQFIALIVSLRGNHP